MEKNNTKQTAIKLLNKYAEEYLILESKLSHLQKENEYLKSNLQINKSIIQGFFQKSPIDEKINIYIAKIKEENHLVSTRLIEKEKETKATHDQYLSYEQNFTSVKEELNKAKTQCFLLENILIEKENIIQSFTKKVTKKSNSNLNANAHNREGKPIELYITNPNEVVIKLNDRIEMYKDINNKLASHIKAMKGDLRKTETALVAYEVENARYKQELNGLKLQRNNTHILMQMCQSPTLSRSHTPKTNTASDTQSFLNTSKLNKSANNITADNTRSDGCHSKSKRSLMKEIEKLERVNRNKQSINQFDLIKEWYETLKYCGLTQEEYSKYCNNKSMVKLTEVIEYLYKLITDKNLHIKLLTEENDRVNVDNLNLNRKTIELCDEIEMLKFLIGTIRDGNNNNDNTFNDSVLNCAGYCNRKKVDNDNSTFVHFEEGNVEYNNRDDTYAYQLKDTISSSEFREAMAFDKFDLESEMSQKADDSINVHNDNQIKLFNEI